MTIKVPHLQFEKIADLIEGRLTEAERARVAAHTGECDRCSEQLARLEQVIRMMRTDSAEGAPRYAIASAVASFNSRVRPASLIERLVATLSFDSLQMAPAAGFREGAAAEQQLVFAAGDNSVHLQVAASGELWRLTGQVLGECEGGVIEVSSPAHETVKVSLSDQCEFELPPLPAGAYSIVFRLPNIEVEIPDLKLGA